ncbi:MAG: ABC transporter permease [Terracidiphilus sp.]
MNSLLQDLRYAMRQLLKSPAFTLTVIVTLALGIGANAAVFTLFDQVLLRMLPVERPKELVRFEWSGAFSGSMSSFGGDSPDHFNYFSYPMYKDLRDHNQVFQGMIASDRTGVGVSWRNQSESKDAEVVTGNYFQMLGLKPAAGRLLTPQDDTAKNSNPVLVLSFNYWKTRFGGAQDVVGQTVLINGHTFTILGVAPQNFDSAIGGYKPGVFIPISMVEIAMPWMAPRDDLNNHQSIWLTVVARLKPGVSAAQAQASLGPLWHALRTNEFALYKSKSERFRRRFIDESHLSVVDDAKGFNPGRIDLQKPLVILMSMAALLVFLCAINVATLLLLRAAGRAREMSMRYALGAKRSRITAQLLTEGGLLGVGGAAVGLAIAPLVATTLVRMMTSSDPGSEPYSATVDARILLFTLAVSLFASLLFSIAPVFHFFRPDLAGALRQNSGTASKSSQRFRKLAVGAQIALSVMLLGGAGLFVRTLDNLRAQNVGFETTKLTVFSLDPSSSGYGEDRTPHIVASALDVLSRIPGVASVAATTDPELSGDNTTSNFSMQGYKPSEEEKMNFEQPDITAGYFATLHQPILVGREFTAADVNGQPKVAVVNAAFAKRFFGTPQNAIGRAIARGGGDGIKYDTTIVGVVGNIRHSDLRTDIGEAVYLPYLQQEHPTGVVVYARTAQAPESIEPAIRQTIHQLDSTLVVDGLRTMEEQISRSASDERALAFLAIGFSALAMVLAAVGLYGVLAYSTEQRTREIGVRLALGSQRSGVVILVVREMAAIAGIAVVVALPSVVGLAQLFRSQLYGVTTFDPLTLGGALFLTAVMVALAAALPARRAASVQPMQALRNE